MADEPKEIHPIVLFNLPRLGEQHVRDFRPLPVAANDAMPVRNEAQPPAGVAEGADPKSTSSATDSAQLSGSGSSETMTPAQTSSSQGSGVEPVIVVKESPSTERLLETTTPQLGESELPAGPTGPTPLGRPPLGGTPSTPSAGNA